MSTAPNQIRIIKIRVGKRVPVTHLLLTHAPRAQGHAHTRPERARQETPARQPWGAVAAPAPSRDLAEGLAGRQPSLRLGLLPPHLSLLSSPFRHGTITVP